jgi:hypothetical protein
MRPPRQFIPHAPTTPAPRSGTVRPPAGTTRRRR